jgi:hypothetical protein
MEEERRRFDELMEKSPALRAAVEQDVEEQRAKREYERQRPAREARAGYDMCVAAGFRPPGSDVGWEPPEPLDPPAPPVFDPAWLPGVARDFATAAAVSFQCPVALVALLILGAVSVAILGKVAVRAKRDWLEPVQLYIGVVLPPSERKSPVFARIFQRIFRWEHEVNDARELAIRQDSARRRMMEKALEHASAKLDEAEVARLTAELHAFKPTTSLTLTVGDTTPEQAAVLAANNGGRIAIVAPEGGVLGTALGRYSQMPNLDFLLNGYSGEAVSIHRVGREAVRISRATVSMVLAVQPSIIKDLFSSREAVGRGLVARFLLGVPEPLSGRRVIDVPDIPDSVSRAYDQMILGLLNLPQPDEPRELTLTADAAKAFHAWRQELEERRSGDLKPLEGWGWGGKLDGQTLRIAATLTMMESPNATEISAVQLRRAVCIARWAIEHARVASASMPVSSGTSAASILLEAIRQKSPATFTTREAYHWVKGRKAMFPNTEAVRPALQSLLDKGWLRRAAFQDVDKTTGRKAEPRWIPTVYLNNPPPTAETDEPAREQGEEIL